MPPHLLTNFEIGKNFQNEPKFKRAYSKNNLSPKIKDWAYAINLGEYESIGTYWVALYANDDNVTCFDSFEVAYMIKKSKIW